MTVEQYHKLMKNMDWYFDRSDDNNVWRSGKAKFDRAKAHRNDTKEHRELWDTYSRF